MDQQIVHDDDDANSCEYKQQDSVASTVSVGTAYEDSDNETREERLDRALGLLTMVMKSNDLEGDEGSCDHLEALDGFLHKADNATFIRNDVYPYDNLSATRYVPRGTPFGVGRLQVAWDRHRKSCASPEFVSCTTNMVKVMDFVFSRVDHAWLWSAVRHGLVPKTCDPYVGEKTMTSFMDMFSSDAGIGALKCLRGLCIFHRDLLMRLLAEKMEFRLRDNIIDQLLLEDANKYARCIFSSDTETHLLYKCKPTKVEDELRHVWDAPSSWELQRAYANIVAVDPDSDELV